MDISIYKGATLEYLGGYPHEKECGIKKGDKLEIVDIRGCCFVIKTYSRLFGEVWANYTEINHERFKKE
jgi:hypothetical protein